MLAPEAVSIVTNFEIASSVALLPPRNDSFFYPLYAKAKINMKIYGLLGKNIHHSLSPVMHNAAFKALGISAEYKIFDINEEKLGGFFEKLKKGEIFGCNVTMPYKEKALNFVDAASVATKTIGALNTVTREEDELKGYNTDYQGFIKALLGFGEGDLNFKAEGKDAFIFGAGGAAKAIIYGLLTMGAKKIVIADIDNKKAEALAGYVIGKKKWNSLITVAQDEKQYNEFISKSDLLVNATPCGMKEDDPGLFDYSYIHEGLYVFDLIYTVETPLIKGAKGRSAKCINGLNMLLYQAARSFEYWTNLEAPLEVMRKALPGSVR